MEGVGVQSRIVLALPATPRSIREARTFACTAVASWGLPDLADIVALLVSELATNVVLHARTPYEVVVVNSGDTVRVTVLDDSPRGPQRRRHGLRATTGRGLALVDTMSAAWGRSNGAELRGRAKGVWFELPTDPARLPEPDEGGLFGQDWLAQLEA